MSEFEKQKKEFLQPLLFEVGAALMDCQGFEFGIALLLFHLGRLGAVGLDPKKVQLILDNQDKKTAGQLIKLLKEHVVVSDGIEAALEKGLSARNILIHRVFIDNAERLPQAETREALVREVRALRTQVQHADKLLRPFIFAFGAALDGVQQQEIEREARRVFS